MASTNTTVDPIFTQLEHIISNSHPSGASAAESVALFAGPAASVAVLDQGTITSHMISTVPEYNTDTVFQACSISKPCAGLGIISLVSKGYFKLEDTLSTLLPEAVLNDLCDDPRTAQATKSITLKQLMSHTAGLTVHGFPGYPSEYHPQESLPLAPKILSSAQGINTAKIQICAPPGLEFMYSGGGMTVMQVVAEHATGKPWEEIMKEHVFGPLGMDRSFYKMVEAETNVAEVYWTGRTKCDTRWHWQPELAAAGLWTTPADLLKLVRALQESLKSDNEGFVSRELAQKVLTSVKAAMGLTWFCGENAFGHGGSNNPGYRCTMLGYGGLPWNKKTPKKGDDIDDNVEMNMGGEGCGIAVMTNASTGDYVIWKIVHAIAYLKGWPEGPYFYGIELGSPFGIDGDIEAGKSVEWKDWIGKWESKDGETVWEVDAGEDGKPVAGVVYGESDEAVSMLKLKTAAVPPIKYKGGKQSIDLVVDGTEVTLRLGWEKDAKVVQMWHHELHSVVVLYKAA